MPKDGNPPAKALANGLRRGATMRQAVKESSAGGHFAEGSHRDGKSFKNLKLERKASKHEQAKHVIVRPEQVHIDDKEKQQLQAQFDVFDADGSGFIEASEFISICDELGIPLRKANELVEEIDDDHDGKITLEEYMTHGVLNHLSEALRLQKKKHDKAEQEREMRTHVNVKKILDVVRAKMENSRLAYAFLRHVTFTLIYAFVIIHQRAPKDSMAMRAALINYFVGSAYRSTSGYEIKTFLDVGTHQELWDWQQEHFVKLYHVDAHYNGDRFAQVVQKDRGTLMQHMRTTSGFRLIQRRSKNGTCASYPQYAAFADDCYADTYLDGKVGLAYDSTAFKGNWSGTEYLHRSNSLFEYGFIENFDENLANTELHLQRLRNDMWINKGTRFFVIEVVLYSSNTGQFAVLQFQVDMRITGRIEPSVSVSCRRYSFYQMQSDWLRMAAEILLICGWALYVYHAGKEMIATAKSSGDRFSYFKNGWNLVDLAYLSLLGMAIGTWIYIILDPSVLSLEITEGTITMGGLPVNFSSTTSAVEFYFALNGLNMLVALMHSIRFLRLNAYLGQLTDAMALMKEGLLQFLLVLAVVIIIFTFTAMALFGDQLEPFSNPVEALDSIMGLTVGFYDAAELFENDQAGAMILYVPFVFVMLFFVLPLTIAIIMEGYAEMQEMHSRAAQSNLQDVYATQVFSQMHRGTVRAFQLFVREKSRNQRLQFPSKSDVLHLFEELEERGVVPYQEIRKKFQDRDIQEDLLMGVIDKYNAFQHDPAWHYLTGLGDGEAEAHAAHQEREDNDAESLVPILQDIEDRVEQMLADQAYVHKKLDLLCEIFPTG